MKSIGLMVSLFLVSCFSFSCINQQVKFRKGRLLSPMMDPAKTSGFSSSLLGEPFIWRESGSIGVGNSSGASCPTCG
jgi:hypothetical protein